MHIGLEIAGLRKSFLGKLILQGVDLSIVPGQTLVLMGASGGGKSVLAKCVLGLFPVDAGSIRIGDADVTHMSAHARETVMQQVGVLFQRGALFDSIPVWHNVAFGLIEGRGVPVGEAMERAFSVLAQLGLDRRTALLRPSELSGGMQKRVALARAIVAAPQFLVLDEPTEGLDPIMADIVNGLVVRTVRELNATTLAITNNITCARKIGTHIALLKDGLVCWQGSVDAIESVQDSYVKKFMRRV